MTYQSDAPARRPCGAILNACFLAVVLSATGLAAAQTPPPAAAGADTNRTEEQLIAALDKMRDDPRADFLPGDLASHGNDHKEQIIATVDELLRRFPRTTHRDEALILKMEMLAHLSQVNHHAIGLLLQTTREIQATKPEGKLAVMTAYYSIQAFVVASRVEDMPEQQRLYGALERYRAFVEDYPDSEYAPVMWASWIRNAIKLGRIEEAQQQITRLHAKYPTHEATKRAMGELSRLIAVGRPLTIDLVDRDGNPAGTPDYYGKVLVVHCWASWHDKSMEELDGLKKLYAKYKDEGLAFLGINADKVPLAFTKAMDTKDLPWQQVFDGKGMGNDVIVMLGVTELPDYFVVDRQGILRAINPDEGLEAYVGKLLKEPVRKIDIDTAPPPPATNESPSGPPPGPKE